ncbi:MAG: DNA polymerase IV [Gammaproteobacteria bacterium]|nr:DNA polymerase IV [Gammaproteobacteria bacterium]
MDAFYASVEEREDPSLAGHPVVVGGDADSRGVVSAANYEARRYGVHSAMPSAQARRLCPQAIFIPPRHALYAQISQQIRAIMQTYTPLVEPLALDEAFLDVTASQRLFGPALEIARTIKRRILDETTLVASVGVASNKFLAKLASDIRKPDALVNVEVGGEQAFLDPLPVSRVWGVGRRTQELLERIGVRTIAELRQRDKTLLDELFGKTGEHLWRLARGMDERPVVAEHEARSVSHETTFCVDLTERAVMRIWLLDLAEQVAARLRRLGIAGRTVHIKVRFHDFRTITRSMTLVTATASSQDLRRAVDQLFGPRLDVALEPVRLLGVGVSGFDGDSEQQGDLFAAPPSREANVDRVLDSVRERFGRAALRRGVDPRRA